MNLIDLMEIWAIKNQKNDPLEMLEQGEFDSRIDVKLLSRKITQVCGGMKPLHNTTDSYVFNHVLFFQMWSPQIERLLDTMDLEYRPLENFSRVENLKRDVDEEGNDKTDNTSSSVSESSSKSSGNNEDKVSAFNSSEYEPDRTSESATEGEGEQTDVGEYHTQREKKKKREEKESNVISGSNGLFSPQQLLKMEREAAEFNVYQWIVQKYMEEMFICVF